MQDSTKGIAASFRSSEVLRLMLVGFLALLLQIPVSMIAGLVSERRQRSLEAVEEVSSKWGAEQTLTGPTLIVPYVARVTETSATGQPVVRNEPRQAVFLPDTLRVQARLQSEERHRGIFSIPVYSLEVRLEGEFPRPDFAELGIEPVEVAWDRARLAIGISDARAIQQGVSLRWNGAESSPVPGATGLVAGRGIQAPVSLTAEPRQSRFSLKLALQGTGAMYFTPSAKDTTVDLHSNNPHPSFQGNWLPVTHTGSAAGFEASWRIPYLGRNYPQAWDTRADMEKPVAASRFGVELVTPVDHYRMAERSVKYASLFIVLTLALVWIVEVLARLRVHPIQYLMLGAALCLFYLLELSLSEHIGFPAAYATASVAVVAMVAGYSLVAVRAIGRALVVGGSVALLYAYLFVLLTKEDSALLIGSIGLFAVLAAIMYATRRVDWYEIGARRG